MSRILKYQLVIFELSPKEIELQRKLQEIPKHSFSKTRLLSLTTFIRLFWNCKKFRHFTLCAKQRGAILNVGICGGRYILIMTSREKRKDCQ